MLADIEARLTEEVRGLVFALAEFGRRAKLISEEVPAEAHFTKLVTQSFALLAFQVSIALGKDMDKPILFDDGVLYLKNLGLNLNEFIREVELDGRRFLAVAFVDQQAGEIKHTADAGNKS
ncbi:hypothetical protein D3C78_1507400 [compost metagenome]